MNRRIVFNKADDRTDPDPQKDYGVSDLEICFLVEGEEGTVEFQLSTNWYLEHINKKRLEFMKSEVVVGKDDFILGRWLKPLPLDVCYYSETRISEDDSFWIDGISRFRESKSCYYGYVFKDKNGNEAKEYAYKLLLERGDDALWVYLEDYYREVFG